MKRYKLKTLKETIGEVSYDPSLERMKFILIPENEAKFTPVIFLVVRQANLRGGWQMKKKDEELVFTEVEPLAFQAVLQDLFILSSILIEEIVER